MYKLIFFPLISTRSILGVFLIIVSFGISSCVSNESETKIHSSPYFDIKNYFLTECNKMDTIPIQAKKTIITNGKEETKIIKNIDWKSELQPFLSIDINNPTYKNSYSIDSISGERKMIEYTAIDSSLHIKKIYLSFNGDNCEKIKIIIRLKNNLYTSYQQLIYETQKGYSIEGVRDVLLNDKIKYSINFRIQ